jgi:hypothetical protein
MPAQPKPVLAALPAPHETPPADNGERLAQVLAAWKAGTGPEPIFLDGVVTSQAACDTRAVLGPLRGWGEKHQDLAPRAGIDVHAALELWMLGASKDDSLAAFRAAYAGACEDAIARGDGRAKSRLHWQVVERTIGRWIDEHPRDTWLLRPLLAECPVADVLGWTRKGTPIVIVGRMDLLAASRDLDGYWVVDHKTSSEITDNWVIEWRLKPSISRYIWLSQRQLDKPVLGALLNGIELPYAGKPESKCRAHGVTHFECSHRHANWRVEPTQRTEAVLEGWRVTQFATAERLEALREATADQPGDAPGVWLHRMRGVAQNGLHAGLCGGSYNRLCFLAGWCEAGRPADESWLQRNLTHAPWQPFDWSQPIPPLRERVREIEERLAADLKAKGASVGSAAGVNSADWS